MLLLIIGGIYVVEALSVIPGRLVQADRRVFLMAPIHHHFEMKGWSETKIIVRFWIMAGILAGAGFAAYYATFEAGTWARRRRCLVVLGLRRSGRPAALLARRELPAARVVALDEGAPPADDGGGAGAAGVEVAHGAAAVLPDDAGLVVKSPGVPDSSAAVQAAAAPRRASWSEVELAGRFLPNRSCGITGTNGKTTTTALTGAISARRRAAVAVGGNIGYALAGHAR